VNAAELANSVEIVSKIAAIVNLFKSEFPDTSADLNPWLHNAETAKFDDAHSVDLAFHFSQRNFACQSYSILMQIRLPETSEVNRQRMTGIELSGHDYMGQQWRFTASGHSEFGGEFWGLTPPLPEAEHKLRQICLQILQLFNLTSKSSVTEQ
jgi:hypothetical protein